MVDHSTSMLALCAIQVPTLWHNRLAGMIVGLALSVWFLLLWFFPLLAIRTNDFLGRLPCFKPSWLGGIEISLRYLAGVGFVSNLDRTLDAWVLRHITVMTAEFNALATVTQRSLYIAAPVEINNSGHKSPGYQDFAELFYTKELYKSRNKRSTIIWISGEGGSGKTSLAVQIARWLINEQTYSSFGPTRMIPVLIEDDLYQPEKDPRAFVKLVRNRLSECIADPSLVSEELIGALLRKGRVVVVIDSLSELKAQTMAALDFRSADFPAKRMIITSRLDCTFNTVSLNKIKPMGIESTGLLTFIEMYLQGIGQRELFDESEFTIAQNRITKLLGTRTSTPLLAKLYADQMVSGKRSTNMSHTAHNIPELMQQYLSSLNSNLREDKIDDRTLHAAMRIIAWECVRETLVPRPAPIDTLSELLRSFDNPEGLISYAEKRLRILQRIGGDSSRTKFTLDPLAEYLAAIHVLRQCGCDNHKWNSLIRELARKDKHKPEPNGFLAALHECCVIYEEDDAIPSAVISRTSQWNQMSTREEALVNENPTYGADIKAEADSNKETALVEWVRDVIESGDRNTHSALNWLDLRISRSRGEIIGSDSWDCFGLPNGRLGVVMFHGPAKHVEAVPTALGIRGAVAGAAFSGAEPQQVCAAVNRYVLERGGAHGFVAMFYGILSPNGELDYVNAGHVAPRVIRQGQSSRLLESTSIALGRAPGAALRNDSVRLMKGDLMVFASDSIIQAANVGGDAFGESKLDAFLASNRHDDPGILLSAVVNEVTSFVGHTALKEDLMCVVCQYHGAS